MSEPLKFEETYFMDNPYLCPGDSKALFRLPDDWAESAVDQLFSMMDSGTTVTAKTFEDSICKVLKYNAAWVASTERRFGKIALGSPSWSKVAKDLKC